MAIEETFRDKRARAEQTAFSDLAFAKISAPVDAAFFGTFSVVDPLDDFQRCIHAVRTLALAASARRYAATTPSIPRT